MFKRRFGVTWVALAITALGCAGWAAAASSFVIALPNGYQMIRGKADAPTIVKKGRHVVVPGPIAAYVTIGEVVTGTVQAPTSAPEKAADKAAKADSKPGGYFVLDTRTGTVGVGLSDADWNAKLKELGVPPSPQLTPPILPK